MQYQSVKVQRHAQYLKYGELTKKTKYIWIALHGYGQTAEYVGRKLDFLDNNDHLVICPEGLNKFYWHANNKPVACWMTSNHRYEEIDDFVGYLDALYSRYGKHVNQANTKVILFAFSQGCATLWRWLHASQPKFDYLINWAGWIPEDISYLHLEDYLRDKNIYLRYGDNDKFITPESMEKIEKVIDKNGLSIDVEKYTGKHNIPPEELQGFVEKYIIAS